MMVSTVTDSNPVEVPSAVEPTAEICVVVRHGCGLRRCDILVTKGSKLGRQLFPVLQSLRECGSRGGGDWVGTPKFVNKDSIGLYFLMYPPSPHREVRLEAPEIIGEVIFDLVFDEFQLWSGSVDVGHAGWGVVCVVVRGDLLCDVFGTAQCTSALSKEA